MKCSRFFRGTTSQVAAKPIYPLQILHDMQTESWYFDFNGVRHTLSGITGWTDYLGGRGNAENNIPLGPLAQPNQYSLWDPTGAIYYVMRAREIQCFDGVQWNTISPLLLINNQSPSQPPPEPVFTGEHEYFTIVEELQALLDSFPKRFADDAVLTINVTNNAKPTDLLTIEGFTGRGRLTVRSNVTGVSFANGQPVHIENCNNFSGIQFHMSVGLDLTILNNLNTAITIDGRDGDDNGGSFGVGRKMYISNSSVTVTGSYIFLGGGNLGSGAVVNVSGNSQVTFDGVVATNKKVAISGGTLTLKDAPSTLSLQRTGGIVIDERANHPLDTFARKGEGGGDSWTYVP